MAIVSYRLYCEEDGCTNQEVIRKDRVDDSNWSVTALHRHAATCPSCNPAVDPDAKEYQRCHEEVAFEELNAIGASGADNLREAGIATRQDVKDSTDEEILSVSWVGEEGLNSIRQEVQ